MVALQSYSLQLCIQFSIQSLSLCRWRFQNVSHNNVNVLKKSDCADFILLVCQSIRFSTKTCWDDIPTEKLYLYLCWFRLLTTHYVFFITVKKKKCFYVLFPFNYLNSTYILIIIIIISRVPILFLLIETFLFLPHIKN